MWDTCKKAARKLWIGSASLCLRENIINNTKDLNLPPVSIYDSHNQPLDIKMHVKYVIELYTYVTSSITMKVWMV
jgi:hypothetical protein